MHEAAVILVRGSFGYLGMMHPKAGEQSDRKRIGCLPMLNPYHESLQRQSYERMKIGMSL